MAAVAFRMPRQPLCVGSYAQVSVAIPRASRLKWEDLVFLIPAGDAGGRVSPAAQAGVRGHSVMLLAGYEPGDYELVAVNRANKAVVGSARFGVTNSWSGGPDGPSIWSAGSSRSLYCRDGVGGGGGGGGGDPENYGLCQAPAQVQLGVVLVDTASGRFSGDLQTERQRWESEIGITASYYSEMSYGTFTLNSQWCGEVHLPDSWDSYMIDLDGCWYPGTIGQAVVTALGAQFDFSQITTLLFLTEPDRSQTPIARVWSCGVHLAGTPTGSPMSYMSASGAPVFLKPIFISRDAGDQSAYPNSKFPRSTLAHELGHTLGLNDLYSPMVMAGRVNRNLWWWDPMSMDQALPGLTLPERFRLGWVTPSAVTVLDLQAGFPKTNVTLTPLELGPAGSGQLGIELHRADGWDYFLEYRQRQANQIADQETYDPDPSTTDAPGRVLNTDVVISTENAPFDRPDILYSGPDDNGSCGPMAKGEEYKETTSPDPVDPKELDIRVLDIDGATAQITLRAGAVDKPDPKITEWGAPPYQSTDIVISNARSEADPSYANVPWAGHDNKITAWVSNGGIVDAPGVVVDFYVRDYGAGGPSVRVGSVTGDVAAGQRVPFEFWPWAPPSSAANGGHFCVNVAIRPYKTPNNVPELNPLNNVAHSNYTKFISETSSPPSRQRASFRIQNPYPRPALAMLSSIQDEASYVTYLEHRWLWLGPGETKTVDVMFEFLPPVTPPRPPIADYGSAAPICMVSVAASIFDPEQGTTASLGGVDAQVTTARATRFASVQVSETPFSTPTYTHRAEGGDAAKVLACQVVTVDGIPVADGVVLLTKRVRTPLLLPHHQIARVQSNWHEQTIATMAIRADGHFGALFEPASTLPASGLNVHYIGSGGFADCDASVP